MTKCLIVDDISTNLYMLKVILNSQGYEVIEAKNGQEAMELALNEPPDIIISDILMPVMDGFQLIGEWKKHDILSKIPFVFFTATYTDEKDKQFARNLGADLFLIKPMDPEQLIQNVNGLLEKYRQGEHHWAEPAGNNEIVKEYNETLIRKLEKKMMELEHEVSTRKKTEEDLRISAERFKLATKSGLAGVWDWNIEKDSVYIEPALRALLGFSEDPTPLSRKEWNEKIHPEDRKNVEDKIDRCLSGEDTQFECQHRTLNKNGQYYWFLRRGCLFSDPKGIPYRMTGISFDITKEINARREVNMLAHAMKSIRELVCISDLSGKILFLNNAMTQVLGLEPDAMIGDSVFGIFQNESREDLEALIETVEKTGEFHIETNVKDKNGQVVPVLLAMSIGEDSSMITWILSNLTEIKEKEKALRVSQKMETIGTMVSGIAHDFNNILSAIFGNAELALMKLKNPENASKHIAHIVDASNRAKNLINQLLTISSGQESEKKPVDLVSLIQEMIKFLKASIPSSVRIETHVDIEKAIIKADSIQIQQVLLNLCTNASYAMSEVGGTLDIRISSAHHTDHLVLKPDGFECENYILLEVQDSGCGIPDEFLERIFEPFFTTKPPGKGTGLGLSVVHGIISRHRGTIHVASKFGEGSTFSIWLPLCTDEKPEETDQIPEIRQGTEKILFVDDEALLVETTKEMLGHLGYQATVCSSSQHALDILKREETPYDLVITDLTMPSMNGLDLSGIINKEYPDLPIILCSGKKEIVSNDILKENGIHSLLRKPFSMAELSQAIREVMDNENL